MKGFPNQVADLRKLAVGMRCLVQLTDEGADARDDGVFGPALVRDGVRELVIDRYRSMTTSGKQLKKISEQSELQNDC